MRKSRHCGTLHRDGPVGEIEDFADGWTAG
jgi:hypothetical protein